MFPLLLLSPSSQNTANTSIMEAIQVDEAPVQTQTTNHIPDEPSTITSQFNDCTFFVSNSSTLHWLAPTKYIATAAKEDSLLRQILLQAKRRRITNGEPHSTTTTSSSMSNRSRHESSSKSSMSCSQPARSSSNSSAKDDDYSLEPPAASTPSPCCEPPPSDPPHKPNDPVPVLVGAQPKQSELNPPKPKSSSPAMTKTPRLQQLLASLDLPCTGNVQEEPSSSNKLKVGELKSTSSGRGLAVTTATAHSRAKEPKQVDDDAATTCVPSTSGTQDPSTVPMNSSTSSMMAQNTNPSVPEVSKTMIPHVAQEPRKDFEFLKKPPEHLQGAKRASTGSSKRDRNETSFADDTAAMGTPPPKKAHVHFQGIPVHRVSSLLDQASVGSASKIQTDVVPPPPGLSPSVPKGLRHRMNNGGQQPRPHRETESSSIESTFKPSGSAAAFGSDDLEQKLPAKKRKQDVEESAPLRIETPHVAEVGDMTPKAGNSHSENMASTVLEVPKKDAPEKSLSTGIVHPAPTNQKDPDVNPKEQALLARFGLAEPPPKPETSKAGVRRPLKRIAEEDLFLRPIQRPDPKMRGAKLASNNPAPISKRRHQIRGMKRATVTRSVPARAEQKVETGNKGMGTASEKHSPWAQFLDPKSTFNPRSMFPIQKEAKAQPPPLPSPPRHFNDASGVLAPQISREAQVPRSHYERVRDVPMFVGEHTRFEGRLESTNVEHSFAKTEKYRPPRHVMETQQQQQQQQIRDAKLEKKKAKKLKKRLKKEKKKERKRMKKAKIKATDSNLSLHVPPPGLQDHSQSFGHVPTGNGGTCAPPNGGLPLQAMSRGEAPKVQIESVQVLCSEGFLESWGGAVAELATSRWSVKASSALADLGMTPKKILLQDTPFVDERGVDFELYGRRAIIIRALSLWNDINFSFLLKAELTYLVSQRRYAAIKVLVCVDVPIDDRKALEITKIGNSFAGAPSFVEAEMVSTRSMSSAIGIAVLASFPTEDDAILDYEALVQDPLAMERIRFLLAFVPSLTVSGAFQILATGVSRQDTVHDTNDSSRLWFRRLLSRDASLERDHIVGLIASNKTESMEISRCAMEQLSFLVNVFVGNR